jgi:MlrC-like protein
MRVAAGVHPEERVLADPGIEPCKFNGSRGAMFGGGIGIDPSELRVPAVKGIAAPRPGYEPIARQFILVDTPGITAADLARFDFMYRSTPLTPLEAEAHLEESGEFADLAA